MARMRKPYQRLGTVDDVQGFNGGKEEARPRTTLLDPSSLVKDIYVFPGGNGVSTECQDVSRRPRDSWAQSSYSEEEIPNGD